ncbi:MAG: sigma-E processing peptidase SpoIIGA [Clostridia bacterium]
MISIEGYLVANFVMNIIIIGVIARSRGRVRWGRVAFAAAFGAVYGAAMECGWFPQLNWMPFKLLLALGLTLAAIRVDSLWELVTGTLLLLGGTVFLGGIMTLAISVAGRSLGTMLLGALVGGAALLAALEARGKKLEKWEAQVQMTCGTSCVRLNALIDTGNHLHEPLSGLPVLICEEKSIRKLLPPGFNAALAQDSLPPGFRLVAYGALGGRGELGCFLPDALTVSYGDGWMKAPDVWVAVYPGKMPGNAHALAPTVIGRIQPTEQPRLPHNIRAIHSVKSGEGSRYRWSIPHSK